MTTNTGTNKTLLQNGFSLVEMILYIAILSVLTSALTVVVSSLFGTKTYVAGQEAISQSGTFALERISREIRKAHEVDIFSSTLLSHPGVLTLNTVDGSNNPTTVRFFLSGTTLMMQEGSNASTPITKQSVAITNLAFSQFTNTNTEAVLVELSITKNIQGTVVTKDFRTFITLDES
jgi:prepilin-type N-terminal cleavage/methylation domain-containing protein